MAVKPTIAYTWATDTNYTSGPYPGQPNKQPGLNIPEGFIPGTVAQPEVVNYLFNATGDWTGWLAAGSSANTIDAHLVETNNQGVFAVVGGAFGGRLVNQIPIFAQQNNSAFSTAEIQHDGGAGAFPVYALKVTKTGGGIGDDAVSITNNGFSWGVDLFSADTSEGGARVITDSVPAVVAEVSTGNAVAVSGKVTTGTGAAGMFEGNSANGAPAVSASQGGAGLTRAPLYVQPGTTDPTLKQAGDIWTVTEAVGDGEARLRWSPDGSTQSVWTTPGGLYRQAIGPEIATTPLVQLGVGPGVAPVLLAELTIPAEAPPGDYDIDWAIEVEITDEALLSYGLFVTGGSIPPASSVQDQAFPISGLTSVNKYTTGHTVVSKAASAVTVQVKGRTLNTGIAAPSLERRFIRAIGAF